MKKLATIALTVAAFGLAFSLAACSGGSSSSSDDDAASLVAGGSGGSFEVLSYSSDDLNNKVFSYEDEDDGRRYLGFTGGKCYKSSNSSSFPDTEREYTIVKYAGRLYKSFFMTRTSGSGLIGTFTDGENAFTFSNGGTGTATLDGESETISYTNNNGLVVINIPGEGDLKVYYDGNNKIYGVDEENIMTFVQNGVSVLTR